MALLHVNPTRMEYNRIKKRLRSSLRGHKLLKDKRDDLVKKFVAMAARNKELREIVEAKMTAVYEGFLIAEALMSPAALEEALMLPKRAVSLDAGTQNLIGVEVPVFTFNVEGAGDIFPYGYYGTSGELDGSIEALNEVLPYLLELSQIEKSVQLLAREIEKTRRTVNALEFVRIPDLRQTAKYIQMKLDENERGNTTRLMKVKEAMAGRV